MTQQAGATVVRRPIGGCQNCSLNCCRFLAVVGAVTSIVCIGLGIYLLNRPKDYFMEDIFDDDYVIKQLISNESVSGISLIAVGCIVLIMFFICSCCICCLKPSKVIIPNAAQTTIVVNNSTQNTNMPNQSFGYQPINNQPQFSSPPPNAPYPIYPQMNPAAATEISAPPPSFAPPPYAERSGESMKA